MLRTTKHPVNRARDPLQGLCLPLTHGPGALLPLEGLLP